MPLFLLRNKLLIIVGLILVISIGLVLIHFWPRNSKDLKLYYIQRSNIEQRITVSGKVISERQAIITAPYDGYIEKLYVKVGQYVYAAAPLVEVVESLQTNEKVYPIRAPYAGTVSLVKKSEGEFVKKADTDNFILEIDDLSKIYVNADVPEINIDKIKIGQAAEIKATAILDKVYHGTIQLLSLAPQRKEGSTQILYPVKIIINDQDSKLKPGMSVLVDIVAGARHNVLVLPHEYIHQKGNTYFVIMANGEKRSVKLGLQSAQAAEVMSGLQINEAVQAVDYTNLSEEQ